MRRGFVAAGIYGALTVALLWPLLAHFGAMLPHDAGDPVLNTWILWHSSVTLPLTGAWWNGPMFFPMADSIALSEVLLSVLPIAWPVHALTHNPVAAYNAVFAVSFPLCGLAAYALARDVTGREDAAIVGGLVFMLAPYRAAQLSHVQVLSYYWAPLVLLGLHRYQRDRHWKWLALFAGSWLAQAMTNGYAMFHVSVLAGLWIVWFMRPLRTAVPVVIAGALAAVAMLPILLKYEDVHSALHLVRDINEVKRFGVDIADFLSAAPDLVLWGGRLGSVRPETPVFPGVTLIALALVALWAERAPRKTARAPQARWQRACVLVSAVAALVAFSAYIIGPWAIGPLSVRDFHKPFSIAVAARVAAFLGGPWAARMWRARSTTGFYLLAMVAMYVCALGPEPRLLGRPMLYEPPYAWLMRLPGFDVLRVPARFVMLSALCQSVLVALAVARWGTASRRAVTVALVSAGILADGWVRLPVVAAPTGGIQAWSEVAAVVELPLGDPDTDFGALFRAMTHGKPTVNGVSGYLPPHYLPLEQALGDQEYSALSELSTTASIGVALDRRRPGAQQAALGLQRAGFIPASSADASWDAFIVSPRPRPTTTLGARVPVLTVRPSTHGEDARRMLDGDVRTAWGTGVPQVGGEEVVVDLGETRAVGGVVLEMGAYSFGYPKWLDIAVSSDDREWEPVFSGPLGVLAVRAAVTDPGTVPITIDVGRANGRYIRLRQTGARPAVPWWIAGLRVHAPD